MKYYEFDTTKYPISYYLAMEEYLLTKSDDSFFIWNNLPGLVIGKNQLLEKEINVSKANDNNVKIYRRKSGGGAVYADEGCFMFSFIVKKDSVDNIYKNYLGRMCKALNKAGVKCALGGRNDLLVDGAKFSGNSIYFKGDRAILHGTILYDSKLENMGKYLTPSKAKLKGKGVDSVQSRVINLKDYVKYTKEGLMEFIQKEIGSSKGKLFDSEFKVIEKLALKYEDEKWLNGTTIPFTFKATKRFEAGEITFMAKCYRGIIEEVKISGDFFECYDLAFLERSFIGENIDPRNMRKAIDGLSIDKFIYGITNDDFKSLFAKEGSVDKLEKMEDNKTCLYKNHLAHNAKMVEFGGFMMPLEYTSISDEHHAVRTDAGLFDCSHMGEIKVTGVDTLSFLNYILTCDVKKALVNTMTYGLLLYEYGNVVDDLMVYKITDQECMLVVNASNTLKDYEYIRSHQGKYKVKIENLSSVCGQLALQGPHAKDYLQELTNYKLEELKFSCFDYMKIDGKEFTVSRSGYTGSDGFEIYGPCRDIIKLFEKFASRGVALCGLGCRDTLRFEAAMPLYGHEISDEISPLEAGLGFAIKFSKSNFIGKNALQKQKAEGLKRKLVGLELKERGIARAGYKLFFDDKEIGYVTTGYMIPGTNNAYALALVQSEFSKIGTNLEVQIRNHLVKVEVRDKHFLDKEYVR